MRAISPSTLPIESLDQHALDDLIEPSELGPIDGIAFVVVQHTIGAVADAVRGRVTYCSLWSASSHGWPAWPSGILRPRR